MNWTKVAVTDLNVAEIFGIKNLGIKKRSAYVTDWKGTSRTHLSGWDGGSRTDVAVIFKDGTVGKPRMTLDPDRMGDPFKQRFIIDGDQGAAVAVIEYGTCMGKPATPTIYRIVKP